MVDRELVLRKLADIDLYFSQLAPYRALNVAAYTADWRTQRTSSERCIWRSKPAWMSPITSWPSRLRVPETGAATFESRGEADLLPPELAASLARMVGFRNILVHDYARLDPAIVMRVLRTDLSDVERFRDAVLALLQP